MLARERISLMRKQKGISTTEMGKRLCVSQGTISRYESGHVKSIPYEKLETIASILGCSVSELIKDDPSYDFSSELSSENIIDPIMISNKEDIDMLKWFHSLNAKERSFLKRMVNCKDDNREIMILRYRD